MLAWRSFNMWTRSFLLDGVRYVRNPSQDMGVWEDQVSSKMWGTCCHQHESLVHSSMERFMAGRHKSESDSHLVGSLSPLYFVYSLRQLEFLIATAVHQRNVRRRASSMEATGRGSLGWT